LVIMGTEMVNFYVSKHTYNHRKRGLMKEIKLSATAKALIKRICNSSKHDLPKLKANLVRLQKGQIKVKDPPREQEWEVVWWHFGRRAGTNS